MDFEYLIPLDEDLVEEIKSTEAQDLGKQVMLHTQRSGVPDLEHIKIAVVGVKENRLAVSGEDEYINFNKIRKAFYSLFPGT